MIRAPSRIELARQAAVDGLIRTPPFKPSAQDRAGLHTVDLPLHFTFLKVVKLAADKRSTMSLSSSLSSIGNSSVARDLKAAVPVALALAAAGSGPAASAAVGVAAAAASTSLISDLGSELSNLGSSAIDGVESAASTMGSGIAGAVNKVYSPVQDAVSSVASGVGDAVSGVESAVSAVADPVTFGLGTLINAFA